MRVQSSWSAESYLRCSSTSHSRQHIEKQRHHFADKGLYSQSYGFSSSHLWLWELDNKKGCMLKIDAFKLWCWRRCLRVLWTAQRSIQSVILKEVSPEYSLEGLMLKWKLQYFGHLMDETSHLIGQDPDAGKDWRRVEKGKTEDGMVGWHHQFNGHEFEQTLGDSKGQGSLVCCSSLGCQESDTT